MQFEKNELNLSCIDIGAGKAGPVYVIDDSQEDMEG